MGSLLWERERRFWTSGADYFRRYLTGDVLVVFPGIVLDRTATIDAVAARPRWTSVLFTKQHARALTGDVVLLQYHARARRASEPSPSHALVTSVYVRRQGEWLLAFHRQTL